MAVSSLRIGSEAQTSLPYSNDNLGITIKTSVTGLIVMCRVNSTLLGKIEGVGVYATTVEMNLSGLT